MKEIKVEDLLCDNVLVDSPNWFYGSFNRMQPKLDHIKFLDLITLCYDT